MYAQTASITTPFGMFFGFAEFVRTNSQRTGCSYSTGAPGRSAAATLGIRGAARYGPRAALFRTGKVRFDNAATGSAEAGCRGDPERYGGTSTIDGAERVLCACRSSDARCLCPTWSIRPSRSPGAPWWIRAPWWTCATGWFRATGWIRAAQRSPNARWICTGRRPSRARRVRICATSGTDSHLHLAHDCSG